MRVAESVAKFAQMLILAFGLSVFIAKSSLASVSSILIDAHTGEVIESNNADKIRYPASLTKVMTLYITFDALEKGVIHLEDEFKVSRTAANRSPSKLGLKAGSTITVKDAVMALIIKSANDCATVLAEGLGFTEENFAKTMTKVAKELGMKNTTFKNASGLPNREQKTTARDMAVLGAAVYHHFPQYYHFFSTPKFTHNNHTYYSHNRLLKTFDGTDGMKTGFTNAAGYNIVTSAERNGHRVIAVTMGHKQAKFRDKKVHSMMNSGLVKLAMADKVNDSNLYAKLEEKTIKKNDKKTIDKTVDIALDSPPKEITVASIEENGDIAAQIIEEAIQKSGDWGIQVGAFSNYTKARNYALQIQKEIPQKYSDKSIDIEAAQKGAAVVYRSKIVGFEKNEAKSACNDLKKSKKSCIVVAVSSDEKLTVAQNQSRQDNEQYN